MSPHVIIKSITINKTQFKDLEKRIRKRSLETGNMEYSYELFKAWSLTAYILGIFTGYGDKNSTKFFYDCFLKNKLPKIYVLEYKNLVKICICIKTQEFNQEYSNSTKGNNVRYNHNAGN